MNAPSADVPNHHADHPGFAGVSGLLVGIVMLIGHGSLARLAADLAAVSATDRVVDVGCGPGTAARAAAHRGAHVTGVDPAPVMLRLARTSTRGHPALTWVEGVAEDLPLPDGSATVVWSLATVHHWRDVAAGLAQAQRVLAPAGRFLAIERRVAPGATGLASHGWTGHQAESFAARCRSAGFSQVQVQEHRLGRRDLVAVRAVRS